MKVVKTYLFALLFVLPYLFVVSCSENEENPIPNPPDPEQKGYFDIWVSIGGTSGMGSQHTQLVKGVTNLKQEQNIDFKGSGTDVTAKLYQGAIIKGQYYYQIPKEKYRFGKYRIKDGNIEIVKEFPFQNNTLKERRYTHAWIDENTLVLIGSNGPSSKILWIKIDTKEMTILAEGELALPVPPEGDKFNTSGIANYRKDGKILYAYLYNKSKTHFFVAFIDPKTMGVDKVIEENRVEFMAGTAYGELLQHKTFFNEKGDYYIACNSLLKDATSRTQQRGNIVRIKKGTMEFDKSYLGHNYPQGKLITVDYLKNDKALLYIQDPEYTGAGEWGKNFNCYYAVLDLNTDKRTALNLPFSEGTFSQRSIVFNNKAYIGTNPEKEQPAVYVYDLDSEELTKGLTITEGYSFDRIVRIED